MVKRYSMNSNAAGRKPAADATAVKSIRFNGCEWKCVSNLGIVRELVTLGLTQIRFMANEMRFMQCKCPNSIKRNIQAIWLRTALTRMTKPVTMIFDTLFAALRYGLCVVFYDKKDSIIYGKTVNSATSLIENLMIDWNGFVVYSCCSSGLCINNGEDNKTLEGQRLDLILHKR